MRAPSASWSMWKRTSLCDTALNSFTGMFTSPKLIEPLQMARAMGPLPPRELPSGRGPVATRAAERTPSGRGSPGMAPRARFRDLPLGQGGSSMLWTITIILFVLWALGMVSGATMGWWIHVLLLLAVIALIFAVMRRGAATV